MLLAWAIVGLVAVASLAGCANSATDPGAPPPDSLPDLGRHSKAFYEIQAPQEVWVTSPADGKRLHNAVYRPDVEDGARVPVFINFSPYWGDTAMTEGDAFAHYLIHEYVPRGYAVVLSAIRGTGHSEGCFQIAGDVELQDAYDVVDFFANADWSNGNVGAGGKSYDATTQNGMIAKFPHPALKTIFHVSGITDMYRYNAKDGVVYRTGLTFNHQYQQQGIHEYGLPGAPGPAGEIWEGGSPSGAGSRDDEDAASLVRLLDDAACPEFLEIEASGAATAADGMKDAYWVERDWSRFLPSSTWNGSIFFVHGLQDWNVKPDHIDPWLEIVQAKGIAVKGWLHQETENVGHVYPMRTDWNITMLRWLDWYLKGIDTGIQNELGFDVQGSDMLWRHDAVWPPAPASWMTFEAPDFGNVPNDTMQDAKEQGKRFAGVPYATVTVTSTSPDPILHLNLYDIGDGESKWIDEAILRVALADDLSAPRPWTPGSSGTFNLTFFPLEYELAAGHHIAMEVGLDPRLTETPTPAGFVYTPGQAAGTTYSHFTLFLPVVESGTELSPQPVHMKCFAC